jgi:sphingomyelin phosphodiesterase
VGAAYHASSAQPSFRIYDVDPKSWDVMDYHQYYAQLNDFATLPQTGHGPVWSLLYSARDTYSNFSSSVAAGNYSAPTKLSSGSAWPLNAPLNGSFWSALTDEMEARPGLVEVHQRYQGRNSPRSPTCTSPECVAAKICYMRSGSGPLGKECPTGYDSVQMGTYH